MEEVRKKCEAVPKPPNEESAARARLWTARTKESFFSANGVLFLNVSEYACVLFALKGGTQARARSTEDGPQKNKKKKQCYLWSPTNKLVQKSVGYAKFQVPEHLHRLAEKLRRVKVMCERNVRVCVCVYYYAV